MSVYLPEGLLLDTPENIRRTGSAAGLAQAVAGHRVSTAASSSPAIRSTAAPTNGLASSFKSIHRLLNLRGLGWHTRPGWGGNTLDRAF